MKSKIKTMKSRPELTDKEIEQYMNFEKVLSDKKALDTRRNTFRITSIGTVLVVGVLVLIYFYQQKPAAIPKVMVQEEQGTQPDNKVVLQESVPGSPSPKEDSQKHSSVKSTEKKDDQQPIKTASEPEGQSKKQAGFVQAEPKNGYPDLYQYFESELKYPATAVKDSIEGIVTIVFSVEENGKATIIRIDNSLGEAFDQEVYRLINNMPPWMPATYNDTPVSSKISLPLTFQLKKVYIKD